MMMISISERLPPLPAPCSVLPTNIVGTLCANAHMIEPAIKSTSVEIATGSRPKVSENAAKGVWQTALASRYDVPIQNA